MSSFSKSKVGRDRIIPLWGREVFPETVPVVFT